MPTKTTKPKKPNARKQNFSKQNIAIIILSILVGVLMLGMIIAGFSISYIWKAQESESNGKITTLILQAIDGLSNPAPIEAQTGKVYFPQVRLVLPAATATVGAEVEYYYSPAEIEFPEVFRIVNTSGFWSARSAMIGAQNMEDTFEQVPKLQACSRGYQVSFTPLTNTQDPLIFTKQLSNGRNVSVYQDAGCKQSNEEFESYLERIDSY